MTYNFDPDNWYDREFRILKHQHRCGDLSEADFQESVADLERRYQEMLDRLDGTYRMPRDPSLPGG